MPPSNPPWIVRDESVTHPAPARSAEEQGEILAEVILLAEAISQGKQEVRCREPLRMPLFPRPAHG